MLRSFVVNGSQPRLQVATPGRAVFHESPLVSWILGAAALAGVVGAGTLLLRLVAQAATSALSRTRLTPLARIARPFAGSPALRPDPVAIVGLTCTAVGAVCSWLFVQKDPTAAMPYAVVVLVAVGTLMAASVTGMAAAATGGGAGPSRD